MANSIIDLLLPSGRIQQGKNTHIFTPEHIAQNMVDLLPDQIWNENTTFLDICSKSGVFLRLIKKKLMNSQRLIELYPDKQERAEAIEDNQLFGICPDEKIAYIVQSEIYGYVYPSGNIKYIKEYYKLVNNKNQQLLIDTIKENFGTMKFDIVIGNPPYNKGMDLDFVYMGFLMSKQYSVFITPAKWQTAEADQSVVSKRINYGQFRKILVPHMSHVCFYPDSRDIFDIKQLDGISYYMMEYKETEKCTVVNKCKRQKLFDNVSIRKLRDNNSLNNVGNEIIQHIKTDSYKFNKGNRGDNGVYIIDAMCNPGKNIVDLNGQTLLFSPMEIVQDNIDLATLSDNASCIFKSDNTDECKSFISWVNTKLVRFLVLINTSGYNGLMTNNTFRFVPAPPSGKFDHIYTDQELYQAFNLPQKYIDVIEAVIKERK